MTADLCQGQRTRPTRSLSAVRVGSFFKMTLNSLLKVPMCLSLPDLPPTERTLVLAEKILDETEIRPHGEGPGLRSGDSEASARPHSCEAHLTLRSTSASAVCSSGFMVQ